MGRCAAGWRITAKARTAGPTSDLQRPLVAESFDFKRVPLVTLGALRCCIRWTFPGPSYGSLSYYGEGDRTRGKHWK